VRNLAPEKRTRRLVNELLEAVEEGFKSAKKPADKLKYVEDVKQIVSMVGIGADEQSEINVIEVPIFMDKNDFNKQNACTAKQKPTQKKPANPKESLENPEGIKTPAPTQFSESEKSIWDDFQVEGIDA
jgi:hypothetical protein